MSDEKRDPGSEDLSAQVDAAERRLRDATEAAAAAEEQTIAEIQALEADLEKERQRAAEAIAAAQRRLAEIEAQTEAAEKRVKEAEQRAAAAKGTNADAETRAREAAAAWLRGQVEAIRREAAGR